MEPSLQDLSDNDHIETSFIGGFALPEGERDFTKWPYLAKMVLWNSGLNSLDAERLNLIYSPSTKRIIIPIYRHGKLIYWTAKNTIADGRKKYKTVRLAHQLLYSRFGNSNTLFVVEDHIGAYILNKLGFEAWGLLGTTLSDYVLNMLYARYHQGANIYLWLDNDNPGIKASKQMMAAFKKKEMLITEISGMDDVKKLNKQFILPDLLKFIREQILKESQ